MDIKKVLRLFSATILIGFGLLTLFLSTSVIFDLFGIRAKEGNYVLFVVWANFVSSFLYLFSAYGFLKSKRWATLLLSVASLILIIAFISLKIHIRNGGVFEPKTVNAMMFRFSLTIILTFISYFTLNKYYETKR